MESTPLKFMKFTGDHKKMNKAVIYKGVLSAMERHKAGRGGGFPF